MPSIARGQGKGRYSTRFCISSGSRFWQSTPNRERLGQWKYRAGARIRLQRKRAICKRRCAIANRSWSWLKSTRPSDVARSRRGSSSSLADPSSSAVSTSTLRFRNPAVIAEGT